MLTILALAANVVVAGAAPCESLQALALPDTTIVSATLVPAGRLPRPRARARAPRPSRSRAGRLPRRRARDAGGQLRSVDAGVDWNGKFQAVGGGGFAGVISYGAMATALGRGYATLDRHRAFDAGRSWALGHPELVIDFAYRAIHEMTVKAKAIVEAFYGNGPRLSYFVGARPAAGRG